MKVIRRKKLPADVDVSVGYIAQTILPGLDAKDHVPKSYRKAVKVMARDTEIAVACAALAVAPSALACSRPPHQ